MVPSTSRGFGEARRLRATVLLEGRTDSLDVLDQALRSLDGVRMDVVEKETFTARVLERALLLIRDGATGRAVGPYAATETAVRQALEQRYRAIAAETPDPQSRTAMVDRANAVREWTLT